MSESRQDRLANLKLLLKQELALTNPSSKYVEDLKLSIKHLEKSIQLIEDKLVLHDMGYYEMVKT